MKIRKLDVYHVKVPFKFKFGHARASRDSSDNLIVRCSLADGTVGFGEGVPRDYVTGETIHSAMAAFKRIESKPLQANFFSPEEAAACLSDEKVLPEREGDVIYNSAISALELSVLDAFGRFFRKPLYSIAMLFVPGPYLNPSPLSVRYSAVLSSGSLFDAFASVLKFKLFGFRQMKVKVGGGKGDLKRVALARRIFGKRLDIRLDANGSWSFEEAWDFLAEAQKFGISAVEEPLRREARAMLPRLEEKVPVILDETLRTFEDARLALQEKLASIFNVRISKCGGFVRSLRIYRFARENGIDCQLGCQVGETAILSAAGRHFASIVRGLKFIEGSYNRFLLARDVSPEDVSFGYGGCARPIEGFGLGVKISEEAIESLKVRKESIGLS